MNEVSMPREEYETLKQTLLVQQQTIERLQKQIATLVDCVNTFATIFEEFIEGGDWNEETRVTVLASDLAGAQTVLEQMADENKQVFQSL